MGVGAPGGGGASAGSERARGVAEWARQGEASRPGAEDRSRSPGAPPGCTQSCGDAGLSSGKLCSEPEPLRGGDPGPRPEGSPGRSVLVLYSPFTPGSL